MHSGMTITELIDMVEKLSGEPIVRLCECEAEATKTYDSEPVCEECWNQLRYWQPGADEGAGR